MVERFHRQLKATSSAVDEIWWTDVLPTILLGIRTALKSDLQVSSTELLYGQPLRLPGDYFNHVDNSNPYDASYAKRLASYMRRIRISNTRVSYLSEPPKDQPRRAIELTSDF